MKRFLKFLATLLALTLIIGTVPVSAAATVTCKNPSKALYVGKCTGTKASGAKAKNKSTLKVTSLLSGYDKNTMLVKLTSSDKTVASVSNKTLKVKAVGVGKATITVKVYEGKSATAANMILSTAFDVTVNKNATDADIKYKGITNGATYKTGETITVTLSQGDDTDKRRITAVSSNVTAKVKSSKNGTWDVTFTKAGAFELKVESYMSSSYKGTTASQTIKGTVEDEEKPLVIDVKQTSLKTFVISGLQEEVEKADIKLYKDSTDTATKAKIDKVVYNAKEGTATVTMYNDKDLYTKGYEGGIEYFVEVDDAKASFKAAGAKLTDVTKFVLDTKEAKVNTDTTLAFKYYNGDVDITAAVSSETNSSNPAVEITNSIDAYLSGAGSIYFTTANVTAVIKATLIIGYDEKNNYEPIKRYCDGAITSVEDAYDGNILYTITKGDGAYMTKNTACVSTIIMGESACLEALFEFTGKTYQNFLQTGYKIQSSNESIVMIGSPSLNGGYMLTPVNPGNASIIITSADGKTTIGAVPVTVKEARRVESFTVTPNKAYLNINPLVSDAIRLTAVAKDQYGEVYKGATYTIVQDENTKAFTGTVSSLSFNSFGICVINGSDVTPSGKGGTQVRLEITCNEITNAAKSKTTLTLNVSNVTATDVDTIFTPATTQMIVEGDTKLDTTLKVGSQDAKNTTVTANFLVNNYFVMEGIGKNLTTAPTTALTAASLGAAEGVSALYFTITRDGKVIDPAAAEYSSCFNYDASSIEIRPIISGKKLPSGTYMITVYKIKPFDKYSQVTTLGTKPIVVSESTPDTDVVRVAAEASGTPLDAIKACYKVYYEGTDVTANIAAGGETYGPDSTTGALIVKKIAVDGLYNSIYGSFSTTIEVPEEDWKIYVK